MSYCYRHLFFSFSPFFFGGGGGAWRSKKVLSIYLGHEDDAERDAGAEDGDDGEEAEAHGGFVLDREADAHADGAEDEHVVDADADQLAVVQRRDRHLIRDEEKKNHC